MRVLYSSEPLPQAGRSVVTVGNFDGVHRGHRQLLKEVVARSRAANLMSTVVTFEPHTRLVSPDKGKYFLLSTFEEKSRFMEHAGIECLVRISFDTAMSRMSPEQFIGSVLIERLHMAQLIMGHGHTIGKDRKGNENFLRLMQDKYHFLIFVADLLAHGGEIISSTQIRELITQGRIAEAVGLLGHPYLIRVERTQGRKLGTAIGYPTLNFKSPPSQKVIPPPGVYAAEMEYEGRSEEGALYFGESPTVSESREARFEFYSFDRGRTEIPVGSRVFLWLYSSLRPDRRFESTDHLKAQIAQDVEMIETYFHEEKMQWR
ncbi:MAG: riboflavin biosynthesis protein RibF [Chitinispirillaceae bacterium]|nr:riboflavin biosynthesis protein RibF [Chitinispirillaceae bacterium]